MRFIPSENESVMSYAFLALVMMQEKLSSVRRRSTLSLDEQESLKLIADKTIGIQECASLLVVSLFYGDIFVGVVSQHRPLPLRSEGSTIDER